MQRRTYRNARIGGGEGYLARRRRWLAAFLAALWRRLVALRLFPAVWFVLSVAPFLFVFFSVCFFSCVFGLVLPLFPFLFSVFFVSLFSFSLLRSTSSSLSPLFFRFFSPSPLCFFFFLFSPFSLSVFSPVLSVLGLYL
jgi:hypothetical protein